MACRLHCAGGNESVTGESLSNGLDLWRHAAENWNFENAASGLFVTLRGHVGEAMAADHFEQAGLPVSWPDRSNEPGYDLISDGNEVQIKIVKDGGRAAADHFDRYPDIPLTLNADAQNIPEHAIRFDPAEGIDPALLVGEEVVLVDDSLTLDAVTSQLAEVFPAADPLALFGDVADPAVGLGAIVAVAQSAWREGWLLRDGHTDTGRALKNLALDGGTRVSGLFVGFKAGAIAGGGVDVATGGATLGLGAVVGGMIGAFGGARVGRAAADKIRLQPLTKSRAEHHRALEAYSDALGATERAVNAALARADANARLLLAAQTLLATRRQDARVAEAEARLAAVRRVDADLLLETASADVRDRAVRLDGLVIQSASVPTPYLRRAAQCATEKWISEATALGSRANRSPDDLAAFWDHLCASPAGADAMRGYVADVGTARNRELGETLAVATALTVETAALRRKVLLSLERASTLQVAEARTKLSPHTRRLRITSADLRRELKAAGAPLED